VLSGREGLPAAVSQGNPGAVDAAVEEDVDFCRGGPAVVLPGAPQSSFGLKVEDLASRSLLVALVVSPVFQERPAELGAQRQIRPPLPTLLVVDERAPDGTSVFLDLNLQEQRVEIVEVRFRRHRLRRAGRAGR